MRWPLGISQLLVISEVAVAVEVDLLLPRLWSAREAPLLGFLAISSLLLPTTVRPCALLLLFTFYILIEFASLFFFFFCFFYLKMTRFFRGLNE
jgi:hypothetical protein